TRWACGWTRSATAGRRWRNCLSQCRSRTDRAAAPKRLSHPCPADPAAERVGGGAQGRNLDCAPVPLLLSTYLNMAYGASRPQVRNRAHCASVARIHSLDKVGSPKMGWLAAALVVWLLAGGPVFAQAGAPLADAAEKQDRARITSLLK